jgi:hypothetical protein
MEIKNETKNEIKNKNIKNEAIELVKGEKKEYEEEVCFVTDKVAFLMRNLIKQFRKNYWGIFDEEFDPQTGRKKIWIPLTESMVEASVKNVDIDTKDVHFRAKKRASVGLIPVVRGVVKNYLDESYFGEDLDEAERQCAIDGTMVWKTTEENGKAKRRNVDLLNCFIDPTARSIQEAYSFIERALLTPPDLKAMDGWLDTDIEPEEGLHNTDGDLTTGISNKKVEVFERWGLMPKRLLTGEKKDDELVEGHIVVSKGKGWRVHLIEKNAKVDEFGNGTKPYEEMWYTRVPGRWYGRGVAEKCMMLQLWMNIVANVRINRHLISQLGIFKIKNGSSVTPQMISKIASNGAIVVDKMDDIEQFVMKEASQSSYTDEDRIMNWTERVTSAFDVVTGEAMPSSTPATNALIQSKSAQSSFTLIKEGFGMFLQRWLKRHAIPILMKNLKQEDVVRLTGEPAELEELDTTIANYIVFKRMGTKKMSFEEATREVEQEKAKLKTTGKERYFRLKEKIDFTQFDVQVYITNVS